MTTAKQQTPTRYRLRLYVSGATASASQAIADIRSIIDKHLDGRYDLEVIDALQEAELLQGQQIVVLPTLIKELPLPSMRLIGGLSNEKKVLTDLGLYAEAQNIPKISQ